MVKQIEMKIKRFKRNSKVGSYALVVFCIFVVIMGILFNIKLSAMNKMLPNQFIPQDKQYTDIRDLYQTLPKKLIVVDKDSNQLVKSDKIYSNTISNKHKTFNSFDIFDVSNYIPDLGTIRYKSQIYNKLKEGNKDITNGSILKEVYNSKAGSFKYVKQDTLKIDKDKQLEYDRLSNLVNYYRIIYILLIIVSIIWIILLKKYIRSNKFKYFGTENIDRDFSCFFIAYLGLVIIEFIKF